MSYRIFLLLTGFGLSVAGGISTLAYLNLLTTGLEFLDYLIFITTNIECLLLPIGIGFIWVSIYIPNLRHKD